MINFLELKKALDKNKSIWYKEEIIALCEKYNLPEISKLILAVDMYRWWNDEIYTHIYNKFPELKTLVSELPTATDMRLYIAVLDEFPDYMVPTLVAHSVLGAHIAVTNFISRVESIKAPTEDVDKFVKYTLWLRESFKKCVLRVNQKEFDKIAEIPFTYIGHENNTLSGKKSCVIPLPCYNADLPNVLKFAKLWKPKEIT